MLVFGSCQSWLAAAKVLAQLRASRAGAGPAGQHVCAHGVMVLLRGATERRCSAAVMAAAPPQGMGSTCPGAAAGRALHPA